MVRLFLYGTLRTGHRNYHKLPAGERRTVILKDYDVVQGRTPRMIEKKGSTVKGEILDCDLSWWQLLRLDFFEWKYKRTRVTIAGEECWTYVWRKHFKAEDKK